jgi:hypothetical protein
VSLFSLFITLSESPCAMNPRHEGNNVLPFIPTDGQRTSTMAGTMRHADPAVRNPWVVKMTPHNRMDALVRQYIYNRVEKCQDKRWEERDGKTEKVPESKREKLIWRAFLKAVNAVTSGENPANVGVAVRKGEKASTVEVYAAISGVGRVSWLPCVVLQGNYLLAEIMRETGPNRVKFAPDHLTISNENKQKVRRFIPSKVEITLIPGQTR